MSLTIDKQGRKTTVFAAGMYFRTCIEGKTGGFGLCLFTVSEQKRRELNYRMLTSLNNARIKRVAELSKKADIRNKEDVFVVEGIRMFREAQPDRILECYVTEEFLEKCDCKDRLSGCSYELVSQEVFRKISDTRTPQGILCVVRQYHYRMEDLLQKETPLLVLLEELQDPGNLGTILRTGEGAGIDGIIMSKKTVDIYNPKTIRATMGSIYRVPFLYTESLEQVLLELREKNIHTYAAHLQGKEYYDIQELNEGCAFLIGNEGNGLKKETADLAEKYIKIPMLGQLESLNAAVAAAILMYEAASRRRR